LQTATIRNANLTRPVSSQTAKTVWTTTGTGRRIATTPTANSISPAYRNPAPTIRPARRAKNASGRVAEASPARRRPIARRAFAEPGVSARASRAISAARPAEHAWEGFAKGCSAAPGDAVRARPASTASARASSAVRVARREDSATAGFADRSPKRSDPPERRLCRGTQRRLVR
jgi:hypothetical protein